MQMGKIGSDRTFGYFVLALFVPWENGNKNLVVHNERRIYLLFSIEEKKNEPTKKIMPWPGAWYG